MAEALLEYSAHAGPFKTLYISIADKIYTNIVQHLLVGNLVMTSYNVQSNSTNSGIDISVQTEFYNFLLLRKQFDPNFNLLDKNILNNATSILSRFQSSTTNLFFRSNGAQITSAWINYAVLKIDLDLGANSIFNTFYSPTNAVPAYPTIASTSSSVVQPSSSTATSVIHPSSSTVKPVVLTNSSTNVPIILFVLVLGAIISTLAYVGYKINKNKPDQYIKQWNTAKTDNVIKKPGFKNTVHKTSQPHRNPEICKKCSSPILVEDLFCQQCGSRLEKKG